MGAIRERHQVRQREKILCGVQCYLRQWRTVKRVAARCQTSRDKFSRLLLQARIYAELDGGAVRQESCRVLSAVALQRGQQSEQNVADAKSQWINDRDLCEVCFQFNKRIPGMRGT